jgi:bacillopeptidase F (M6 metalloprotease family)
LREGNINFFFFKKLLDNRRKLCYCAAGTESHNNNNKKNKTMYFQENGAPEPQSSTKGGWMKIDSQAAYSKKEIKCGPGRSKAFRHPGETVSLSPQTVARKQATAVKIEMMKSAALKRRILIENPLAKRESDGSIVLKGLRGEKGKFLPKIVLG